MALPSGGGRLFPSEYGFSPFSVGAGSARRPKKPRGNSVFTRKAVRANTGLRFCYQCTLGDSRKFLFHGVTETSVVVGCGDQRIRVAEEPAVRHFSEMVDHNRDRCQLGPRLQTKVIDGITKAHARGTSVLHGAWVRSCVELRESSGHHAK